MSKANDLEYRIPWIVFDRDQVQGFDEIIAKAEREGIQVDGQIRVLKYRCMHILVPCR